MSLLVCLVGATLMLSACGGRTELIALPQIGQIADNAIIDNGGGITVVARSETWSGPPLDGIIPLQLTIDNGSSAPLRIRHTDFVLVTPRGRILPLAPPFERVDAETSLLAPALAQQALVEGVLQPAAEVSGFIYFSNLDDADNVDLVATFVDASTNAVIATVQMYFEVD
jgi:hypothetical protein